MGYGSRALQALNAYYSGEFFNLDEATEPEQMYPDPSIIDKVSQFRMRVVECACAYGAWKTASLLTDTPSVRAVNAMPPLLQRLTERKPETLDYLGVSYGLTPQLLR